MFCGTLWALKNIYVAMVTPHTSAYGQYLTHAHSHITQTLPPTDKRSYPVVCNREFRERASADLGLIDLNFLVGFISFLSSAGKHARRVLGLSWKRGLCGDKGCINLIFNYNLLTVLFIMKPLEPHSSYSRFFIFSISHSLIGS